MISDRDEPAGRKVRQTTPSSNLAELFEIGRLHMAGNRIPPGSEVDREIRPRSNGYRDSSAAFRGDDGPTARRAAIAGGSEGQPLLRHAHANDLPVPRAIGESRTPPAPDERRANENCDSHRANALPHTNSLRAVGAAASRSGGESCGEMQRYVAKLC